MTVENVSVAVLEDDAVLSFLEKVGPRDEHLGAATAVLAQGIRDDHR